MKRPPLSGLARAAASAGRAILAVSDLKAREKADASPVTEADLAAHRVLVRELAALLPVPVISEESVDPATAARDIASLPQCWLVDPLDGTKDFIAGTGEFTVNIALMEHGRPVLGCVYAPALNLCLTGGKTRKADPGTFTCLVSRSHAKGEGERLKKAFPRATVTAVGSSLKYALIADGKADVSIRVGPTSLWDTAAAQALLEAAGGALLTFDGKPLSYTTGTLINPPFVAIGDPSFPWQALVNCVLC